MSGRPFSLGTFAAGPDEMFAGLVVGSQVARLDRRLGGQATVRSLLADWEDSLLVLQDLADEIGRDEFEYELEQLRPLPPVHPAGQLFQAGANYKQHLVELMTAGERSPADPAPARDQRELMRQLDERALAGTPYVFTGVPYSLAGARDAVVLPDEVAQPDWELELAVVIGRSGRRVSRERAMDLVAGYTICNDITARDRIFRPDVLGIGTDWLAGKSWPTFSPVGPYIVPARHVANPGSLRITLRVNGRVMQDASTADMMFDIPRLLEHVSSITELHPGDLLLTGSPAGNGVHHGRFLRPGDVIDGEITGLGSLRNECVAEREAERPSVETQHDRVAVAADDGV